MSEFLNSLKRLGCSALNAASALAEKKKAEKIFETQQIKNSLRKSHYVELHERFRENYDDFSSGLKNCIDSNHQQYGLRCPRRIEDLFCDKAIDMIDGVIFPDGGYQDLVFRYEAEREAVDINIHTISAGTARYVSEKEIERRLQTDLPKYIGEYCFTGLTVSGIGEKVTITIYGVDRPPDQIQPPNWGIMIW